MKPLHLLFQRTNVALWLLRIAGVIALLGVPLRHIPNSIDSWLPFDPDTISNFAALIIGIFLLYLASQLSRKKYFAYLMSLVSLGLLIGFELLHHQAMPQIILYCIATISLVLSREQYIAKSNLTSVRRTMFYSIVITSALVAVSFVAFIIIDQREFGTHLSTQESFTITKDAVLGKPVPDAIGNTREDVFLVDTIRLSLLLALGVILLALFRPLRPNIEIDQHTRAQAEELLRRYSDSSEDFFKLWPTNNKHLYFYGDSFISFGMKNGVAIILDGCTGNPILFEGLRKSFLNDCHINGWDISMIHATKTEAEAWKQLGGQSIYIGSEAQVTVDSFETIKNNKHFRYIRNKAQKENLEFEFWEAPLSSSQIRALKSISDEWLASGDRREYQFAMGYFDTDYLRNSNCAVLVRDTKAIAYANFIPTYNTELASIDHMRFIQGLSSVAMHFLLMQTISHLASRGIRSLNLGLAPLAKLKDNAESTPEKLLIVIKRLGSRYYSFGGLEQFKNKFEPTWEPRYLVYFGQVSKLVPISVALNSLMSYKVDKKILEHRRLILLLAVIAAIGYASFPLALFVNPSHALTGLVSLLAASGQPYAWLFNWLDVVSGVITAGLFGYIYAVHKEHLKKQISTAALLLAISGFANVVSAIVDLPDSFVAGTHITVAMLKDPVLVTHGAASFVNTLTYMAAIILWFLATKQKMVSWRGILTISVLLMVTVGFVIGQLFVDAGYVIQRIQILLYSVWLVWFTRDILRDIQRRLHR